MRLGIIGSTGHVNYVMDGLRLLPGVRLVAISPGSAGESMERLTAMVQKERLTPAVYGSYLELLDEAKLDVVAIACHYHDHAKIAADALRRGIHVFVEKPVATTLDDLAMLKMAYAASGGAKLAAMLGIRYDAAFLTAWHAVKEGAVGDIRLLQAQKSYRLGSRPEHFKRRETYGGTIPWVGSHAVDWVHWFSGERFESVYASHSTMYNHGNGELEATALCHYTMTNEVLASVSIDYLRPAEAPTHGDDRLRIAGSDGVIEVRNNMAFLINGKQNGVQELLLLPNGQVLVDFVRSLTDGGSCVISAEDSFYITEICLKSVISADEKTVVSLL